MTRLLLCVTCLLACLAADWTVARPVRIRASMFWSTCAFSTFAQFGAVGTNQLDFAACAKGASCGLLALTPASDVVFGMTPAELVSWRMFWLEVYARIQSIASGRFWLDAGIARSDPPRNVGMNLPRVWLGIGNAPRFRFGLPFCGSVIRPHSHPFEIVAPT